MKIVVCHSTHNNTFTIFALEERFVDLAHNLVQDFIPNHYLNFGKGRDVYRNGWTYESNWDFELKIPIEELVGLLTPIFDVTIYTCLALDEYRRPKIQEILKNA